jgi:hypothetical protein
MLQRRSILPPLTALFGLAAFGCSGPHDKEAQQLADAICPQAYACCTPDGLKKNSWAGSDVASCRGKTKDGFKSLFNEIQSSEDQGRSAYDGDKVAACIARVTTSSCGALNQTSHLTGVPDCASFVKPLTPIGGSCSNDWECTAGHCVKLGGATVGQCTTDAGRSQSCAAAECEAGLICDPTQICRVLTATAVAAVAATATTAPAAPCFYASSCAAVRGPGDAALFLLLVAGAGWVARRQRVAGRRAAAVRASCLGERPAAP